MDQGPRQEDKWERLDRNLNELLQELRIVLPGVQVLFAFLLAVPFQARFSDVTPFQETLYFITLMLTSVSMFLLMTPTAFHRLTFRLQQKDKLLRISNGLTIAGLAVLALAMIFAVSLITDFLFDSITTLILAALLLVTASVCWFVVPLRYRARRKREGRP